MSFSTFISGKCHFLPGGGGLLKIGGGSGTLSKIKRGGSKDFFKLKRVDHLYLLKK